MLKTHAQMHSFIYVSSSLYVNIHIHVNILVHEHISEYVNENTVMYSQVDIMMLKCACTT